MESVREARLMMGGNEAWGVVGGSVKRGGGGRNSFFQNLARRVSCGFRFAADIIFGGDMSLRYPYRGFPYNRGDFRIW